MRFPPWSLPRVGLGLVKGILLLRVISWMQVVTWVKGSGSPGRHVQVHLLMSFQILGIQRQGDGKDCAPLPPKWGVRLACLAIFSSPWGWVRFALGDAWNLPSEGRGVGFFPAGESSRRGWCAGTSPLNSLHACARLDSERMTVAAELSAALHHSRDGRQVSRVGLRAQKTDSSWGGRRPGVPEDPGPPQLGVERAACPRSTGLPPLPDLCGGEVHDATLVKFLLRQTLLQRKKEEEERKKEEEEEKEQFLEQSMQELRLLSKTPVAGRSLQQTNRMMELLNLRDVASS